MSELKKILLNGSKQMHIQLNERQTVALLRYIELIVKWNKTYNLSAISSPLEGVKKHLLDSLSIMPYIDKSALLDVGSGAGLPGIVISIMRPELDVSVIDSVGKKCRFMQYVKSELSLDNLSVINDRVELYRPTSCFGQITSRAFAEVEKTINITKHLLCSEGHYLLMKGDHFDKEKYEALNIKAHKISVPYVSDDRYLLEII